jgi:hypothetical protein
MGKGTVYVLLVEDEKDPGGALASDWAVRAKQTVEDRKTSPWNVVTQLQGSPGESTGWILP